MKVKATDFILHESYVHCRKRICDVLRNLVPFVQFKNVKDTHGWMLLVSEASACNFTKSNTPWVFFTFFKSYKWYQMAQSITFVIVMAYLGGWFGINCPSAFWKFWNCLSKTRAILKFSKITKVIYSKNSKNQICDYWLITPNQRTLCNETNIF